MKKQNKSNAGIFSFWHDNPPAPFNPLYDARAKHWQTLAVYDAHIDGIYNLPLNMRPPEIAKRYEARKSKGDIDMAELRKAEDYLYNL
jgi:hypothetical protein